jgi:hypothetical protein
MRYWGYFAAKLAAAAGILYGLLWLINGIWPAEKNPPAIAPLRDVQEILAYNIVVGAWFLLCFAALFLIVRDQRRRCRTCLRRLRMPVQTGSWGSMLLLGRPRTESICPYGHGTLKEEEVQISGTRSPEWTAHRDGLWEELCASSKESGKKT